MHQIHPAAVTLVAIFVYMLMSMNVGRARVRYRIAAPAVTGHEHFERAYRIQMNTLERMPVFLSSLWLYAIFVADNGAALGGLVWIVGRVIYAFAYAREPKSHGPGFGISALAELGLFLGAAYGIARALW